MARSLWMARIPFDLLIHLATTRTKVTMMMKNLLILLATMMTGKIPQLPFPMVVHSEDLLILLATMMNAKSPQLPFD